MKKLLLLLALVTSVQAQDGSFNGTVFDLDSGHVGIISGSVEIKPKEDAHVSNLRRINAELEASINAMRMEYYANQQVNELRRQTELLEKIADK